MLIMTFSALSSYSSVSPTNYKSDLTKNYYYDMRVFVVIFLGIIARKCNTLNWISYLISTNLYEINIYLLSSDEKFAASFIF